MQSKKMPNRFANDGINLFQGLIIAFKEYFDCVCTCYTYLLWLKILRKRFLSFIDGWRKLKKSIASSSIVSLLSKNRHRKSFIQILQNCKIPLRSCNTFSIKHYVYTYFNNLYHGKETYYNLKKIWRIFYSWNIPTSWTS